MRGIAGLIAVAGAAMALCAPAAGAAAPDRDRDGLPDRWERKHRLSTKANNAGADTDRDRVDNANEWREGTSPRDRDSDGDGRPDGREDADGDGLSNAGEDATGNDPRDRDSDDDGVVDGNERAGVVSSFKSGVLRINLGRGAKVSGAVTGETEVTCARRGDAEDRWLRRGRGKPGRGRARAAQADDDYEEPYDEYEEPYDEYEDEEYEYDDGDGYEDELGEDAGEQESGERPSSSCRLKTGAKVREAELLSGPDGAVFVRIELVR